MTTFLLYDDSVRSPEMRHEIGLAVGDPIVFLDHAGRRIVVGSILERGGFERREDVVDEFWSHDELGYDDLIKDPGFPLHNIGPELVLRALRRAEVDSAVVPPTFRLNVADYLRDAGITLDVDAEQWQVRRRHKTPWELEGIERAQRAAETAMLTAARMLREADATSDGRLRFEGEILTAELVREAMQSELLSQGAESEEILVQTGDACLDGHGLGSGPILNNQSCIIDCFPRDRRTGVYTDMTRTFVPGTPSEDLVRIHRHCLRALEIAYASIRPGHKDAHEKVTEYFHEHGFPTREHHEGEDPLVEGYPYALGHGVGLEVHERPWMGRRSDELIAGDVVAVEPGLYFAGVGGIRLEDTVIVTDDGPEHLTDPYPYDLAP
ncbi:MAG TPA: M24 family metallopeptidase [Actinomycetota bacterium]|nr:M24 family metallopeptidase [Actinomycetota bacterium]